jgi:oxalate decarboxylase/phosphoglucose isomerase-like protein (cupin superfamily)
MLLYKFLLSLLVFTSTLQANYTRLSFRQRFNTKEFIYKLGNTIINSEVIYPATVDEMPTLIGERLSYQLVTLESCSMGTFHLHPRASELLFVLDGVNLQVGFIEENGGRTILNEIGAGHVMLYPKGLIHFENNLGCAPVRYLSAMNNEDPGMVTIANRIIDLPSLVLQTTLNISQCQIGTLKNSTPMNTLLSGIDECKKRCNSKNSGTFMLDMLNFKRYFLIFLFKFISLDN